MTLRLRTLGLLDRSNLVSLVNVLGGITVVVYTVAMMVYPWIHGGWSWSHVQVVWDRWQALNVGVLAFMSSLIAFNIAGYNASRQREREFVAARAFLPSALSELVPYFKESARVFKRFWDTEPDLADDQELPELQTPRLPDAYKGVFADCIRHASPEVGEYLSRMLVGLQIHNARLQGLLHPDEEIDVHVVSKHSLLTCLYRLAELQALVAQLFEFARGESVFTSRKLEWEDFRNAFGNLNIRPDQFVIDDQLNLTAFTQRQISKQ